MADEITIVVRARDEFSSVMGNFGNIITGIKSAIDLASDAFRTFGGLAIDGLNAIASYERMSASLETLAAKELLATGEARNMNEALQMAAPIAEELLEWNQQLAINSPFTAEGVNNAFRMAQAYGFTVEEAKRLTQALIDFAAGSGASEAAMEAIARALGQISATGKVTGGDMLQLVNAGLPVVEILAEGFNVTTAELMDMRTKGLLPATEAIEYITQYLENNFAGAAERQATTWAGLQGTFADIRNIGLREYFGGIFEALQPLAIELSNFLQTEGIMKLREWGESLGTMIQPLAEYASNALQAISYFNQMIRSGTDAGDAFQNAFRFFLDQSNFPTINQESVISWADGIIGRMIDSLTNRVVLWNAEGGPAELIGKLTEWIGNLGEGVEFDSEATEAAGRLLGAIIDGLDAVPGEQLLVTLDQKVAGMLRTIQWQEAGAEFTNSIGRLLSSAFSLENTSQQEAIIHPWIDRLPFMMTLRLLTSESVVTFAMGILNWLGMVFVTVGQSLASFDFGNWMNSLDMTSSIQTFRERFDEMGRAAWQGLVDGLNSFEFNSAEWIRIHLTDPVKRFLGIASPSTVFMQIGIDVISGLILGLNSMFTALIGFIGGIITTVTSRFRGMVTEILDFFSQIIEAYNTNGIAGIIDLVINGVDMSSSTGTVGGGPGDSTHSTSSTASGSVVYNFFGPVYVRTEEDMEMFCPSPHPLVAASGNTLTTSGIG